ncbi:MAG: chitobiase/beta-hexosaminidase C-terminal domain-containing protein [Haloferula sp.]
MDVQISCATPSASIRYTLNGEDPQLGDPLIRSGGVVRLANSATLKARAWAGGALSDVAEEDYRITGAVAFGKQHGLSLSRAGKLWSWGYQANGRLGNGQTSGVAVKDPVRVLAPGGMGNFDDAIGVAAGFEHSLVIASDGAVFGFGRGGFGQLRNGSTSDASVAVQAVRDSALGPALSGVTSIAAGEHFSLAALDSGEVLAWGLGNNGRRGDGTSNGSRSFALPVERGDDPLFPALSGILRVVAGPDFGLAREPHENEAIGGAGGVWVWGLNSKGQLGTGNTSSPTRALPMLSAANTPLTDAWSISGGESHSAVVRWKDGDPNLQGTVWCSGSGWQGRLGNGVSSLSYTALYPVQVLKEDDSPLENIVQVAAGAAHTTAVDLDGNVWAWGSNAYGQLGNNSQTLATKAVQVLSEEVDPVTGLPVPLTGVVAVAVGGTGGSGSSMALDSAGEVWVWGRNNLGQLGNGEQVVWGATKLAIQHEENHVDEGAPSVSLVATVTEAVAPGEISFTATPGHSGSGGLANVDRIEYFLNGNLVATLFSAPWTTAVSNLPGGDHHAFALVYDTAGVSAMSTSFSLTINPFEGDDPDGDGLSTTTELNVTFSDPYNPDSDDDGMRDGYEVYHDFPVMSKALGTVDGPDGHADSDGISNLEEQAQGSGAKMAGDYFSAIDVYIGTLRWFGCRGVWYTVQYWTAPTGWITVPFGFHGNDNELVFELPWITGPIPSSAFARLSFGHEDTFDFDNDGLTAAEERLYKTDPTKWDTDGDGYSDGAEVGNVPPGGGGSVGNDPLDPADSPKIEWVTLTGDLDEDVPKVRTREVVIPRGQSRLIVVAVATDEYPKYTDPTYVHDEGKEFHDPVSWTVSAAGQPSLSNGYTVDQLDSEFDEVPEGFGLEGFSPALIKDQALYSAPDTEPLVVTITCTAENKDDGTHPSTVLVGLLPVSISEIEFSGDKYWELWSDKGDESKPGGTTYKAPHWTNFNRDSDPLDVGEVNYPVAYTRASSPKLMVRIEIELPEGSGLVPQIKAQAPGAVALPATEMQESSSSESVWELPVPVASGTLPNVVKFYSAQAPGPQFDLFWSIKLRDGDAWLPFQSTYHTVYVTFADPVNTVPGDQRPEVLQETLFNISCRNADGLSSNQNNAIVDAIYEEFTDQKVARVVPTMGILRDEVLSYYGSETPDCSASTDLLASDKGDGSCGAFAGLFTHSVRAQGIFATMVKIDAINPAKILLVKNWHFVDPPDNPGTEFPYTIGTFAREIGGISAQGNEEPGSSFNTHVISIFDNHLYDPSYGTPGIPPKAGAADYKAYEDSSFDGFAKEFTSPNKRARKNNVAAGSAVEVQATPVAPDAP